MSNREEIVKEALTWIGTPYHPHARVKGAGVDCAMLLAEVYEKAGVLDHLEFAHYSPDWHLHQTAELYLDELTKHATKLSPDETPMPGDIAMFKYGRTVSHGSIVVSWPTVIHSYNGLGVVLGDAFNGELAGRFYAAFRLKGLA